MNRTIAFELKDVAPTPARLRLDPRVDAPATETTINLGQLFLQSYFDSYPKGPPKPDPSNFEYLDLIASTGDFRFHAWVQQASTLKKRHLSAELGQAFCRTLLHDHFGISYFAHLGEVISNQSHAAFEGLRIRRASSGDIPDYLCARKTTEPFIGEGKGRFSAISFASAQFDAWRAQFSRIEVLDRRGQQRRTKGFIVATRFSTEAQSGSIRTKSYIEDPFTPGEEPLGQDELSALCRTAIAIHYSRIFRKLDLAPFASALSGGYSFANELTFQVPTWTCNTPPFEGTNYIGGFFRTGEGVGPQLTENGWTLPFELGRGHAVFVGLDLGVARTVVAAARGNWRNLSEIAPREPRGLWSSEFAWSLDGTVVAPALSFVPTGSERL